MLLTLPAARHLWVRWKVRTTCSVSCSSATAFCEQAKKKQP